MNIAYDVTLNWKIDGEIMHHTITINLSVTNGVRFASLQWNVNDMHLKPIHFRIGLLISQWEFLPFFSHCRRTLVYKIIMKETIFCWRQCQHNVCSLLLPNHGVCVFARAWATNLKYKNWRLLMHGPSIIVYFSKM